VIHVKAGTSGRYRKPRVNYAFHYGMFRFYRQHYARNDNVFLRGAVYGGIALKLGVSLARSAVRRRLFRRS